MIARRVPTCPRVSAETSWPKRSWDVFSRLATAVAFALTLSPVAGYADRLRLVERSPSTGSVKGEEGTEVEVIEEQPDAFIVKIPKGEVELIKRETPTEIKLWKEKKILWEDQGDYLVISLPKERIAPPPTATGEEASGFATAASLEEGLAGTGVKGQHSAVGILTGNVTGRVLQHGRPQSGCRVKLSAIQGTATELTRLLGAKTSQGSGQNTVEVTTGSDGVYLFEDVPIGDYDISWLPPGATHWLGWLSDEADVTVRSGEITRQGDTDL
ncbi:MAG: hypothetical protein HYY58_02960 [Candidatus Omnitrophica bacterium]|nr:hypothetical protein [Candidatus Omnitrophota bacterium]